MTIFWKKQKLIKNQSKKLKTKKIGITQKNLKIWKK